MNSRTVKRWIVVKKAIKESKKGRKRVKFSRTAKHPEMEEKLYDSYKELRRKGLKVKRWWFLLKAKSILKEIDSESTFRFSDDWFTGFKRCHKISLRRATNTSQKYQMTRDPQYSIFIVLFERKQRKEILLALWASGPRDRWQM